MDKFFELEQVKFHATILVVGIGSLIDRLEGYVFDGGVS